MYIRGRAWLVRVFRRSMRGVTSTPPWPLLLAEPAPLRLPVDSSSQIREKISLIQTEAHVYIRGRAWLVRVFRRSMRGVTSTPPWPLLLAEPAPLAAG